MRRGALPWLTVGLLVLGVGAGVGLGIAGQTPTPAPLTGTATGTATAQISRIVAATRRAGTARFTYASTGTSTNRLLRATSRGSGEVDFGAATLQTTQRDRSIGFSGSSLSTERPVTQENVIDQVWIGRTEYTRLEFNDNADSPWMKGPTFPKNTFGSLGALQQVGPLGELSLDEGVPGLRVEDIGSGTVHGAPTTEYQLVVPTCDGAHTEGRPERVDGAPPALGRRSRPPGAGPAVDDRGHCEGRPCGRRASRTTSTRWPRHHRQHHRPR